MNNIKSIQKIPVQNYQMKLSADFGFSILQRKREIVDLIKNTFSGSNLTIQDNNVSIVIENVSSHINRIEITPNYIHIFGTKNDSFSLVSNETKKIFSLLIEYMKVDKNNIKSFGWMYSGIIRKVDKDILMFSPAHENGFSVGGASMFSNDGDNSLSLKLSLVMNDKNTVGLKLEIDNILTSPNYLDSINSIQTFYESEENIVVKYLNILIDKKNNG